LDRNILRNPAAGAVMNLLPITLAAPLIAGALTLQYVVGHAERNAGATGWTGLQVRMIRAAPLWAYVAIWLGSTAVIVILNARASSA
jgi:hypothetical protein